MSIGRRVKPIDWEARTTGRKLFASDVELPGLLHAGVVRSPHPHAEILGIDVDDALGVRGVMAELTATDFGDRTYPHMGAAFRDRHPLAKDRVRFVGEGVVALAAESLDDLRAAMSKVRIRYRVLRAATTVEEARARGAAPIHDRRAGTNLAAVLRRGYGEPGVSTEAVEVVGHYAFGRQTQACMEPSAAVARWDAESSRLELWTTTQSPRFVQEELADVLGLDRDQVVLREVAVGGGFGARSKICDHEAIAAGLAIKAGRPVRVVYSRQEEFATTKCRHDFAMTVTTRSTPDGTLTSQSADFVIDNGAYNHSGPSVMHAGVGSFVSAYRCPDIDVEATLVDTNKHPGGQFRGYGGIQAYFALESQMDRLAATVGIDPIDIRIRNLLRTDDVTLAGWHISSTKQAECLEIVRDRLDWDRKRAQGGSGRGVGVASSLHHTGLRSYPDANRSEADVSIDLSGRVTVRFGGADPGTGLTTVLAQVASFELGVPLEDVQVQTMDTDETPHDLGSWSSRATFMGGHAVRAACAELSGLLGQLAAGHFGVDASQVDVGGGVARSGERELPYGKVVSLGDSAELQVRSSYEVDTEMVNPETGIASTSPSYAFAAHGVEVEVNRRTGEITVLKVVAAQDSGTVINPVAAEGQVVGGVAMGLGAALGEQLVYEGGQMANAAYMHYAQARSATMPVVEVAFVEHEDPLGPYGAKAAGEISMVPIAPAVANAVEHAVGVRITELPLTPDKVLTALGSGGRRGYALWRRPGRWWIALIRSLYPLGLHHLLHRWGTRLAPLREAPPIEVIHRPTSFEEAADYLDGGSASPIAGGTDLMPARTQGVLRPRQLVDLTLIDGFAAVDEAGTDAELWIGAGLRLSELEQVAERNGLRALVQAIPLIASPQIRQMATLGGNLCQQKRCWFFRSGFNCYKRGGASCPCYAVTGDSRYYHAVVDAHRCQAVTPSDLATVLVAMDARAEVVGPGGRREIEMRELYSGPGETALVDNEVLAGVRIPRRDRWRTGFRKLRLWEGDFAVVAAACAVRTDPDGTVREARVVLGAVAPVPMRTSEVESALIGRRLSAEVIAPASTAWVRNAHPLARNEWKVDAMVGVLAECLEELVETTGPPR